MLILQKAHELVKTEVVYMLEDTNLVVDRMTSKPAKNQTIYRSFYYKPPVKPK